MTGKRRSKDYSNVRDKNNRMNDVSFKEIFRDLALGQHNYSGSRQSTCDCNKKVKELRSTERDRVVGINPYKKRPYLGLPAYNLVHFNFYINVEIMLDMWLCLILPKLLNYLTKNTVTLIVLQKWLKPIHQFHTFFCNFTLYNFLVDVITQ